jgi:hypothetical protein
LPGDTPPEQGDGAPRRDLAGAVLAGGSAFFATEVSLRKEEELVVGRIYSVDEQIKLGDHDLRKWMATSIVWTFISGNIVTLLALGGLVWLDQMNIERKLVTAGDRIIDRQVIMTLLGATTVQVGAIAVIIARYLFPGRPRE